MCSEHRLRLSGAYAAVSGKSERSEESVYLQTSLSSSTKTDSFLLTIRKKLKRLFGIMFPDNKRFLQEFILQLKYAFVMDRSLLVQI